MPYPVGTPYRLLPMSLYAWIAIAASTWLGVACLFGLLLGEVINFGAGGEHLGEATARTQLDARRPTTTVSFP
jgi:hypothetical protein